jgi:hypothetical protein
VAHRASEQYKAFRSAVGTERLLESPSDLEFWHSTDVGFLTKGGQARFSPEKEPGMLQYVVIDELAIPAINKLQSLEQLERIAERARQDTEVLTFWVLERESAESRPGSPENNLYVFMRFHTKAAYTTYCHAASRAEWETIWGLVSSRRITEWEEAGIGFLGR